MTLHVPPFDLAALNVFLAVCDNGSMAAAGRMLGITQPAVSQTIADLEKRVGTQLFDRGVRPMVLTTAGTVLRQYATGLMVEMRQIAARLQEMRSGRVHLLRIGVVDSLSRAVMGEVSSFMRARVDRLVVHAGLTESHAAALLTRQIDFILSVDDLEDIADLERWPLFEEPYILLCPAGVRPPTEAADLPAFFAAQPFVRFSLRSRTGNEIERYLRRLKLDIPYGQEFDRPEGVLAACRLGGVAITTPLCLYESGFDGSCGLTCHRLPVGAFRRRLTLVARRREFGRLPLDFAKSLRTVLMEQTLGELAGYFPVFADQMDVLS
ncbi:HTH-type transcriptional regulator CynR [Komagataeibacter europaeus]|uniref:HTH-type transcriptional regulator CynR n=1 Tax=Komagataeibacter europaeus TaxID=33995 RepID=A0A0M0EKR5_KOMEU|nr:LysR family transcriptional regulator [Komagataeibacter europaeus]ARW15933.1 HTH-type transcriptional regulator AbgR [Komagataeibacter europaeus]KON65859.1 HTH-type transcriptional regulator CynR [Komagataeibacter europaeus]